MKKDIIVVGGGIAGLIATLTLAHAGKEVLLLEKNESCGGLMSTFSREGFQFEGGARALVNAGLIRTLVQEFALDIEMLPNPVTLGIAGRMLRVDGEESLMRFAAMLKDLYPASALEVDRVIRSIHSIMADMQVLYGANNPLFKKRTTIRWATLPSMAAWMLKFTKTMYRMHKMSSPFEDHLDKLSSNQSLKDMIGQHFFRKTPAFFALSYFALYNDYLYPKGGVGAFVERLVSAISTRGGEIAYRREVTSINPQGKFLQDSAGNEYQYNKMIWAGDLKTLYSINSEAGLDKQAIINFRKKKQAVLAHKGAKSVFTVFLGVDLTPDYFQAKSSGHSFYTPDSKGWAPYIQRDYKPCYTAGIR